MAHHVLATNLSKSVGKINADATRKRLLKSIALMSHAGAMQFFKDKVGPDGKPWPALRHLRPDGSNSILEDTGRLRNSVKATVIGESIVLQASHPGAAVHQYGATIKPVRAKFLAIPMTQEAKRTQPRRMKGLFFLKTASNRFWLAKSASKGSGLVLHYRLASEVKIPARTYLGWSDETLKRIEEFIADSFADVVEAPFSGKKPTGV